MAFEINGVNGYYDGKVSNESEKYGRNSVANHMDFVTAPLKSAMENEAPILNFTPSEEEIDKNIDKVETFANKNDEYLNSLPPLEYEYRYMPNGNFDKDALLGAAKEEMGADNITVEDFEKNYLPNENYTASALDVNKDGKIDISEYSASILAADILSKETPDVSNIDGSMNSKGMDAVMTYSKKSNSDAAVKLYSQIHSTYNLSLNA